MDKTTGGWINGFAGMLIFSGSLPATRVAVACFDPLFLTAARAAIAGVLALALLLVLRKRPPVAKDFASLAVVACGVVVGFPLLTACALRHMSAAHSIVYVALLPLATAAFGVWRGAERLSFAFWLFACAGSALVAGFAATQGGGIAGSGSLQMIAAIVVCGLGYAEGGRLSRRLGGWQVISWALALSLPVTLPLALIDLPASTAAITPSAWVGLLYVSLFSMFIGFIFWYRGLAQGGIAAVGQLQLLQPFFGLFLVALLLHEPVGRSVFAITAATVACVAGARRFASDDRAKQQAGVRTVTEDA